MHIIARKILVEFSAAYPDSKKPLDRWWVICRRNDFNSFADLKRTFSSADKVGQCVVFNIGGGKYRLVARVNFRGHRMWIKHILPHKDYDRLNLEKDERCLP